MKFYFTLLVLSFTFFTGYGQIKTFRTNLYIVPDSGGSPVLMDGTLSFFDNSYSNAVDNKDARKMFNPGENWGMSRDPYVLIVERRKDIENGDTIFFKMWNTRVITYRLEMIPKYFSGGAVNAFLIDKYLGTETPVNLLEDDYVDFKVTADPESKRTDRFMLVFNNQAARGLLPLNFISSNAIYQNKTVSLQWQTANEQNVNDYTIEKSADGSQFTATTLTAGAKNIAAASYVLADNQPFAGANYYRIRATDKDGRVVYSDVMKVTAVNISTVATIFPNPATASNIRVRMHGQQAGNYNLKIINNNGTVMHAQAETLTTAATELRLTANPSLVPGIYRIEITGPDGYRSTQTLLITR